MIITPNACGDRSRVGSSASRRVGNAVVRNRIKRRVRDWFRRERESLPGNVDLVVIARNKASRLVENGSVAMALDKTLARAKQQWKATS